MGKFFTAAKKIPLSIGTLDGRTRIPWGPYTLREAVFFLLVGGIAVVTCSFQGFKDGMWTTDLWLSDGIIVLAVAVSAAVIIRVIPMRRNLLFLLIGVWRAYSRPRTGTYKGNPIIQKPTRLLSQRFRVTAWPEGE